MGWGDRDEAPRCRLCGEWWYSEGTECRYHPGRLMDYDRYGQLGQGLVGDFFECCGQRVTVDGDLPGGCTVGRHERADPNDPGPVQRDLEAQAEVEARIREEHYESTAWTRPERVEEARWRVRRWLAGRLKHRDWEKDLAARDVTVLEKADSPYLLEQLGKDRYVAERRRFIASLVTSPELTEQARSAAG